MIDSSASIPNIHARIVLLSLYITIPKLVPVKHLRNGKTLEAQVFYNYLLIVAGIHANGAPDGARDVPKRQRAIRIRPAIST